MDLTAEQNDRLAARLREVVDRHHFMVLGTAEDDGTPRLSPVYFNHDEYRTIFWVSSPESQHSRNIAREPRVSLVVFDTDRTPAESPGGVYIGATASEVPVDELERECRRAFRRTLEGAKAFTPDELSGDADLRLYRAEARSHEVHVRGRDPEFGQGIDRRIVVHIS